MTDGRLESTPRRTRSAWGRAQVVLLPGFLALLAMALVGAACGDGDGGADQEGAVAGTTRTLTAKDIEFQPTELDVPVGEPVTLTLENRDEDIRHNIHLKLADSEPKTEIEAGVVTQTLEFTVEEPGSYEYVCDVHPNMVGTLVAGGG